MPKTSHYSRSPFSVSRPRGGRRGFAGKRMANLRTAGKNFHFLYELGKLDERLRVFLTKHDMDQVLNFANFFEHVPATDDALKLTVRRL